MHLTIVIGTRPEAIKLAPLVRALRAADDFQCRLLFTGQHSDVLHGLLPDFEIGPAPLAAEDRPRAGLTGLSHWLYQRLRDRLRTDAPDAVLVQGDTQSAVMAAMAAADLAIPVAHVEAGLRSGNALSPFPEELNRRLISRCASVHFAPTPAAARRLRGEGTPASQIAVTGNTVIDSLHQVAKPRPAANPHGQRLLVTCHRRENWGGGYRGLTDSLRRLSVAYPRLGIDFVLHPNPALAEDAQALLGDIPQIALLPALPYAAFLQRLRDCLFVLSDSGGIQEEAPFFGKYMLVLRNNTERREALDCGLSELTGTDSDRIFQAARRQLDTPRSVPCASPFGDGQASARIVEGLRGWRHGRDPLLPPERQFGYGP